MPKRKHIKHFKTGNSLQFTNGYPKYDSIYINYPEQINPQSHRASLVAQMVKNLPAMQETQVQSLVGENPLERGIKQPPPVFLPGESHGQSSLSGYNPWSRKELDTTEQLSLFICILHFVC